jgi:hypothetical protein
MHPLRDTLTTIMDHALDACDALARNEDWWSAGSSLDQARAVATSGRLREPSAALWRIIEARDLCADLGRLQPDDSRSQTKEISDLLCEALGYLRDAVEETL